MMLKRLLNTLSAQKQEERRAELYRDLIRREAKIGGQVFGPIESGMRREFFCLDEHTWVWHEEWVDQRGQHLSKTTRYDVRPSGILKSQNGQYQQLTQEEGLRLYNAALAYRQSVNDELYSFAI